MKEKVTDFDTEATHGSNVTELNAEPSPEYIAHKKKVNVTELSAEPAHKRKKDGVEVVAIPFTLLHIIHTVYTPNIARTVGPGTSSGRAADVLVVVVTSPAPSP